MTEGHKSDCAVHNEPASPNGPCDCGYMSDLIEQFRDYAGNPHDIAGLQEDCAIVADELEALIAQVATKGGKVYRCPDCKIEFTSAPLSCHNCGSVNIYNIDQEPRG